jgi:phosphoribosylglycinamide formyltransferase-1
LPRKDFADAATFSAAVFDVIDEHDCDLVCLAGFLSLLVIPEEYEGRVLNIHPSLLPKFGGKGMHGQLVHQAVLDAGETESGCTVHLADNTYDTGPVLLQRRCPVEPGDNAASLAARIFELECEAYPQAITDYWRALRSV